MAEEKLETGIVVSFDSRVGKTFGFLFVQGQTQDVYFHYGGGRRVSSDGNSPDFSEGDFLIPLPCDGDEIVFKRIDAPKGPKAITWAFKSDWDKAQRIIDERNRIRAIREGSTLRQDS